MKKKILFYCSWGGFGHIARAYSVSKFIDFADVTVASAEKWIFDKPNKLKVINLPEPKSRLRLEDEKIILQNYKDVDDTLGYRQHLFSYLNVLKKVNPDLVIVDNPAEIAIYTKMLGYKTCIVYETLKTEDLRWRLAWKNVDKILVPYTKDFSDDLGFNYSDNSFFSGGYTRFEGLKKLDRDKLEKELKLTKNSKRILLTIGKGKYGEDAVEKLMETITSTGDYEVLFPYFKKDDWSQKIQQKFKLLKVIYGKTNLLPYFSVSDIVITGAGYNSVMEAFGQRIPTILIPLDRIYGEQYNKAKTAERMGAAKIMDLSDHSFSLQLIENIEFLLNHSNAQNMIKAQEQIVPGDGAKKTAELIKRLIKE